MLLNSVRNGYDDLTYFTTFITLHGIINITLLPQSNSNAQQSIVC